MGPRVVRIITVHWYAAPPLAAMWRSHCTHCSLRVRAAESCSITAGIDESIDLELLSLWIFAYAAQRAATAGSVTTIVTRPCVLDLWKITMAQGRRTTRGVA